MSRDRIFKFHCHDAILLFLHGRQLPEKMKTKGCLAYIKQNHVGDFPQIGAFIPNFFLEIQQKGGIFLQVVEGEHVLQNDDSCVFEQISCFFLWIYLRPETVIKAPLVDFSATVQKE